MTTSEAYRYVIREIEKDGYDSDEMSFEEHYEIYDRLNRMEDTSKEAVDQMIEEVF